jgi:hypothetical protein
MGPSPDDRALSFSKIFRRVTNPVKPFGFTIVQNDLPPPLLDSHRNGSGKPPCLFDQMNDCLAKVFQSLHVRMRPFVSLSSPRFSG